MHLVPIMVRHGLLIAALLVAMPATASHELARITEDQQLLNAFAGMVMSASTFLGWEVAAFVVRGTDGRLQCMLWPTSGNYESQVFRGGVPENAIAIVHTHPPSADRKPSPGDVDVARRLKLPIYVLTRFGIYAADPSSGDVVPIIRNRNWVSEAIR